MMYWFWEKIHFSSTEQNVKLKNYLMARIYKELAMENMPKDSPSNQSALGCTLINLADLYTIDIWIW